MENTESKGESKSTRGKRARSSGKRFEIKVRENLEENGYIVVKWTNQIDFQKNKIVPARNKFNPFLKRVMSEGSGYPDYLIYHIISRRIIGLECKTYGYLDREEKKRSDWLISNKIFDRIIIAKKGKSRGEIIFLRYEKQK